MTKWIGENMSEKKVGKDSRDNVELRRVLIQEIGYARIAEELLVTELDR
jgi:hypothetical protein